MKLFKLAQRVTSLALALASSCVFAGTDPVSSVDPNAASKSPSHLSPTQQTEVRLRAELANTIVQNVAADAQAKGATESWRIDLLSSLYRTSSGALGNIAATATTLDQAHAMAGVTTRRVSAANAMPKALGDSGDSLVFTPMTACRFIDTRNVGGPITSPRDFNSDLFGNQLGGSATCFLPVPGEPAIAANVTVVVPPGVAGFLGVRPAGSTNLTSFVNWSAAGTPTGTANAGIIVTALVDQEFHFNAFALAGTSPQLIVDIFGYFSTSTEPAKSFDCMSTTTNIQTIPKNTVTTFFAPACPSGYQAIVPYCLTTDAGVLSEGSGINDNTVGGQAFCSWSNFNSTASGNILNAALCCRTGSTP